MARKCLVCSHINKLAAERQYLQGIPITKIAQELAVGSDSVRYHMENHLSRQLVKAYEQREISNGMDMLGEIDQIITMSKVIFKRNYDKGADVTALKALDSHRSTLELLCKISAYMHESKLAELQQTQSQSMEEQKADLQKSLECLTMPELIMFRDLSMKINKQDPSIIVIPGEQVNSIPDRIIKSYTSNESSPVPAVKDKSDISTVVRGSGGLKRMKTALNQVSTKDEGLKESPTDDSDKAVNDEGMPSWYQPGRKYEWINGKPIRPTREGEGIPRRAGGDTSVSDFLRDRGVIR